MILSVILLGLIVVAAGVLMLSPLRGTTAPDPDAVPRAALEAERDRLYSELGNLTD